MQESKSGRRRRSEGCSIFCSHRGVVDDCTNLDDDFLEYLLAEASSRGKQGQ